MEVKPKRQTASDPDDFRHPEANQTLGAFEGGKFVAFPDDFGAPGQIEQISSLEIHEQKSGPRIEENVPQRIEMVIAAKIGENERPFVFDPHETGFAATVRDVYALGDVGVILGIAGGDEEGVGAADQIPGGLVQMITAMNGRFR